MTKEFKILLYVKRMEKKNIFLLEETQIFIYLYYKSIK